jgi:hypothetical protein
MKKEIILTFIFIGIFQSTGFGWDPPVMHCVVWDTYRWVYKCSLNADGTAAQRCCEGPTPADDQCCGLDKICCGSDGACHSRDPNMACCGNKELYSTDSRECCGGKVIDKCSPDKCESCDSKGGCQVCNGDPNLACHNGRCCCVPNGCGPCGDNTVPDNPTACADTSFFNACFAHDNCYRGCGNDKISCDTIFLTTMLEVCTKSNPFCSSLCITSASIYYDVVLFGGGSAFDTAQSCWCP